MAVTVTAANTNTRVNDSDTNTNWSNLGGGGPSPASEAQLRYQGASAVNRKVTSTGGTLTGVQYDPGSGAVNMTAAANRLWLLKGYVADFGDLNTTFGVAVRIGSGSGAYYRYNVAGSGAARSVFSAYPAQGGYLIIALDPNIAGWRESTTGSPALTAVDYFGLSASFVVGGAKSENVALDAIDIGTGLQLYGGTPDGTYQSFVDTDQGNTSNRWGYVIQASGAIFVRGMLVIGRNNTTPTATGFTTNPNTVVVYPDGYHSAGLFGTTIDLGNASTAVTVNNTQIGRGSATTEDTRPDFIYTGTSGTATLGASLTNFRNITLTSAVTVNNADIECQLLTQSGAEILDSNIRTNAVSQVACLQDPTFGSTTDLRATKFEQTGAGHAIELDTATTYTFTDLTFEGYGGTPGTNSTPASGANDAAILNSSGGAVTIQISGGHIPSVRNTAGSTTTVVTSVDYTLVGMNDGTELTVLDRSLAMIDVTGTATTLSFGNATATERMGQTFSPDYAANAERIKIRLRKVGTPTDGVTVSLWQFAPGSILLAESLPLLASNITTSFVEYDIDLNEKNALSTGSTWGISIQRTGAVDGSNYYQIEYSTVSVIGSGVRLVYNGSSWNSSTGDLLFSVMEAASDNELFHVESSVGTETYTHGGTVKDVEVLAMHIEYLPIALRDTLQATNSSITLSQTRDRVFSNP